MAASTLRGIKYIGMLPPEGYGVAAQRAVVGLARAGVPVTFSAVARSGDDARWRQSPELAALRDRPLDYDTVIIHAPADQFPRVAAAERGKRVIGMTTWETDRVPPRWPAWLNAVEQVIVPCEWNRAVFAAGGCAVPIHVVPHISVAPELPAPRSASSFSRTRPFVVNAIGVWGGRKNLAAVVGAYLTAFGASDATELVIKTTARDLTCRVLGYYPLSVAATIAAIRLRCRSRARIRLITESLPSDAIAALHARADCYLSMSRGEGWGLGVFDAAAGGCPVVTPVHGGTSAYLPASYPLAVRWREVAVAAQGYEREVYQRGQRWIEPDERHAARLLRAIYEAPAEAMRRASALAEEISARFGWRPATDALLTALGAAR